MKHTRIELPLKSREAMADLFQKRLAESIDLALRAKESHWNVRGPNFRSLHELFDDVHEVMENQADLLAERMRQLGGEVQGSARFIAKNTSLPESSIEGTEEQQHVAAMANALAAFGKSLRTAIDRAEQHGDSVSADIFTEVCRVVDKNLWVLESHLPQQKGKPTAKTKVQRKLPALPEQPWSILHDGAMR